MQCGHLGAIDHRQALVPRGSLGDRQVRSVPSSSEVRWIDLCSEGSSFVHSPIEVINMLNDLEPIDLLLLLLHIWYMPVLNCVSKSTPAGPGTQRGDSVRRFKNCSKCFCCMTKLLGRYEFSTARNTSSSSHKCIFEMNHFFFLPPPFLPFLPPAELFPNNST